MVSDRNRHDARRAAAALQAKALLELVHEGRNDTARWRHVSPDDVVVCWLAAEDAGLHSELTLARAYREQGIRCVGVELLVEPAYEGSCRGLLEFTRGKLPIACCLNPDLCARLQLQVAPLGLAFKVVEQCSLDVTWPSVVPLDEVTVVALWRLPLPMCAADL